MDYSLTPGTSQPAYPDRAERNPKKKTPAWIAQFGFAFACEVMRQPDFKHWIHAANLNDERLRYMFGQQDGARYDRFWEGATKETDPTGISQKLDKRILPIVPKHVRILSDKLAEQEFAPVVTVVDERGDQEKEQHLDSIRLWQQQGDWLKAAGIQPPADLPAELPEDEDDLRTYAESEYQHEDAVALEQKLALCLSDANYKQLDRDVVLHFFAFGEACQFLAEGAGGRPLPVVLRPGSVLLLPSTYEDYRDARAAGHVEYLTLAQVRAEAGEEFWAANKTKLMQAATGNGYDWWLPQSVQGEARDMERLKVVRFSFLSEDDLVWKTGTDRHGNPETKRKTADPNADFRGGEITRRTALNVYEGVLVLGTDLHYNCRLAVRQLRDSENPLRGLLPYAAFTPGLVAGFSSCPMDEVMGIADFCQEQWLRLQEACLRAVPQGYNFDPEALLEAVAMLKGNNAKDGLDLGAAMKMFYRTGNTTGRRRGKSGEPLAPPVTPNEVTGGQDIQNYWTSLRAGLQMLETIMGSNAVVSAATPNPEVGNGQSELAVAGTMSNLGYLLHGKRMLFESVCRAMGLRLWLGEDKRPVTGSYSAGPGKAPVRVKPRPELTGRRFNFRIERRLTQQDKQDFRAILAQGLQNKTITEADYAYLIEVDNVKEAWRILAQRVKRNQREAQKLNEQNQMLTFKGQAMAAQEAEKAKQETIRVQLEADKIIKGIEGQNAARVAQIYVEGQQRAEQERHDAKLADTRQQVGGDILRDAAQAHHDRAAAADPGAAAREEFSSLAPADA